MRFGFKSFAALAVLSAAVLAGCAPVQAAGPEAVTVVTIDQPKFYLARPEGDGLNDIVNPGDIMVINGPLFDEKGDPVGGYVTRRGPQAGTPLVAKRLTHVKNGDGNFAWRNQIFLQRADGSFLMIPYDASQSIDHFMTSEHAVFLIQNGPALVADGKNLHDPASRHVASRIGIGFTRDNRLIVADSQDPVTMHDLAEAMLQSGVVDAVYLDGNRNGFVKDGREQGRLPRGPYLLHIQGE